MAFDEELETFAIATKTNFLIENKKWKFGVAFNFAFHNSQFPADYYHTVRLGVKSIFRKWEMEKARHVYCAQQMAAEAHEIECPLV